MGYLLSVDGFRLRFQQGRADECDRPTVGRNNVAVLVSVDSTGLGLEPWVCGEPGVQPGGGGGKEGRNPPLPILSLYHKIMTKVK